jgi:Predicted signal-transduction protein containing cAMP-binding and CBS domains
MTIGRIIANRHQDIVHCSPETSVREAARLLAERRIGALPVMEGEQVAGIFSERDLLYCVARDGEAALDAPVREVMTAPPITVDPSTSALDAASLMTQRRIRHLPVIEDGRLVAFVSIGDIVKYRLEMIENEAQAMRDYIRTA